MTVKQKKIIILTKEFFRETGSERSKGADIVITVKEIAQACNVSPSTVSNILNGKTNASEETRKKVMAAVKELVQQILNY